MAEYIMMMGTSSDVGKSIIAAALCRILHQDGINTAPFKAQNMALNSYVTKDGKEMGRAQVVQAEAAGIEPAVEMNPVLLKPTGNSCSQVILMGKPVGNMSAREYHKGYSLKAFDTVTKALKKLISEYDALVIEGAGSPAEVNLKDNDIVNMRIAKYLKAPVLLVADIDRGGALAAIVGTLELLEEDERDLVKGIIINKFRGDESLFTPAVDFLENKTGKPVLGIMPYLENLGIEDEDSVALDRKRTSPDDSEIQIAIIETPKISNFTDFDAFSDESDTGLYYVRDVESLGKPDLIILAGSKNTTEDMIYLRESGLESAIKGLHEEGTPIIGICGGYQMLGRKILDPMHTESDFDGTEGFGLLDMTTSFAADKVTSQAKSDCVNLHFLGCDIHAEGIKGYEIHMGRTDFSPNIIHPFRLKELSGNTHAESEGAASQDGLVFGTYLHGLFDHDIFRRSILNAIRRRKGLKSLPVTKNTYTEKQLAFDRLADTARCHLNIKKIKDIMRMGAHL